MRVYLPSRNADVELVNAVNIAYREFARDLGDLYDAKLRPLDARWIESLSRDRRKALTLHDPYFVLDEPLRNEDSVTRSCFGRTDSNFWGAMEKARVARNGWVHTDTKVSVRTAMEAIRPLVVISTQLGLEITQQLNAVLERLTRVAAGHEFDEHPDTGRIQELVDELEAAQARKLEVQDQAVEAFVQAQSEFVKRTQIEERAGGLELENSELRRDLEAAIEGWGRAVAMADENVERQAVEYQTEVSRLRELIAEPPADIELPVGLEPGGLWPDELPIGSWDLELKPAFLDFFDLDKSAMLRELQPTVADDIREFAEQCLAIIPQGGLVYVDHCGHIVRWAHPTAIENTYVGTMPRDWVG